MAKFLNYFLNSSEVSHVLLTYLLIHWHILVALILLETFILYWWNLALKTQSELLIYSQTFSISFRCGICSSPTFRKHVLKDYAVLPVRLAILWIRLDNASYHCSAIPRRDQRTLDLTLLEAESAKKLKAKVGENQI